MTDDLGRLRQAMSDLAEHGGGADMYERTLRNSRKVQRRTRVAAGAAAAAAVLGMGGTVAVATASGPRPATPPTATHPTTPAPTVAPSVAPTSAPPTTPTTPSTPRSSTTSDRPAYPKCPSAKALEKLVDLPKDWYFVPSSVQCWRTWATADPDGPNPGDGVYLFRYERGTGWRYHSQGSGYQCQDLGITAGDPPFCSMD